MRVGDYEIKFDGHGYAVGKRREVERPDGRLEVRLKDPKYYLKLDQAIGSLPDRVASDLFNLCEDFVDFRARFSGAANELLEPMKNAVAEALQAGAERAESD